METDLIADRGNGPAVVGTRITVYNLIPELFDPSRTERQLCDAYDLTPGQVAAARAYVLNHYAVVMAEHHRIQERFDAGNPPDPETIRGAKERLTRNMEGNRRYVEVDDRGFDSVQPDARCRGRRQGIQERILCRQKRAGHTRRQSSLDQRAIAGDDAGLRWQPARLRDANAQRQRHHEHDQRREEIRRECAACAFRLRFDLGGHNTPLK